MGAADFYDYGTGETVAQAFNKLVEQAQWDHGHAGYTGTIAEKGWFVEFPAIPGVDAMTVAEYVMQYNYNPAIADWAEGHEDQLEKMAEVADDKWGDAACLPDGDRKWLFFGWASS